MRGTSMSDGCRNTYSYTVGLSIFSIVSRLKEVPDYKMLTVS